MERRASFASEETERHDQLVKRFRSLCDMHRVPCGDAGHLHGFAEHLSENRHLAMDFWAFVGEFSNRERGSLSDDEMLALVVEGISDRRVEELPAETAEAANRLRQMISGVDVGAPDLPVPAVEPEAEMPSAKRMATLKEPEASADRTHTQQMIADALLKLEDTARELREHLAVIEREKAAKTAPAPAEEVVLPVAEEIFPQEKLRDPRPASRTPDAIQPLISYLESAAKSANQPAAAPPNETMVFAPRPAERLSKRGFAPQDPEDDPSIPVPLAAYSDEKKRGRPFFLIVFAGMLLLLSGAWFVLGHGYARAWLGDSSPLLQNKLELFRQEIRELRGNPSAPTAAQPSGSVSGRASSPQPPAPAAAQPSVNLSPAPSATADADKGASPQTAPTLDQQAAPSASGSSGDVQQPVSLAGSVPRIPSATMQANLLSSRVPAYPDGAKRMRIEGVVSMEILISKTGVVQRVHVLHGDSQLRMAAIDAVLRWRYKPYLQDGRPIAVMTQVNVPFRLSQAGN